MTALTIAVGLLAILLAFVGAVGGIILTLFVRASTASRTVDQWLGWTIVAASLALMGGGVVLIARAV